MRIVFVCAFNEGRSAHLELMARTIARKNDIQGLTFESVGLNRGNGLSPYRKSYLVDRGVPVNEIAGFRSRSLAELKDRKRALFLVAERAMAIAIVNRHTEISFDSICTVRGYAAGILPNSLNDLRDPEARILDSFFAKDEWHRRQLFMELDNLAEATVSRTKEHLEANRRLVA
jgi:protein-tyrosine-phosphatase